MSHRQCHRCGDYDCGEGRVPSCDRPQFPACDLCRLHLEQRDEQARLKWKQKALLTKAETEIASLRAEVERLTRERDDWQARVALLLDIRRETFEATRDEIAQMLEDNRDNPEGALNTSQMVIIIRALTLADIGEGE